MKFIRITLLILLSLLIIGSFAAYILFNKNNVEVKTLDETARKNATGSFIQLSDGVTHYEIAGADTSKLIILVHGFSVPYYIWDSTFTSLVQRGFRVLRYDEFGRGFSDRPDKTYEASLYRQQISELLDKLHLKTVYAIAGVSFGGAVATDFVIHNPNLVNKVILVDPVYPGTPHPSYPESFVKYYMAVTPDNRVNGQWTDLKYPQQFPQWANQYKVQMQYKGFQNALVSTLFHYAPAGGIVANYQALDALHKPVMLIWGKEDQTVPFTNNDSLRKILHTEFIPVEDAAHLPQMEKATLVNKKIIEFLERH